jgi:hypothetical protein
MIPFRVRDFRSNGHHQKFSKAIMKPTVTVI